MKPVRKTVRFWLVFSALLISGAVINIWERAGEARIARESLKNLPQQIGLWRQRGADVRFDPETEKILRADDYVSRNFELNGRVASLYVGYYTTQRNGATYHSPLNCLPGSGWVMSDGGRVNINSPSGQTFEANRYLIQNGSERAVMIYWYQGRGKAVASEYWAKVDTVLDSVRRRRSDGALVRVMVPLGNVPAEAERTAIEFSSLAAKELPPFVPE